MAVAGSHGKSQEYIRLPYGRGTWLSYALSSESERDAMHAKIKRSSSRKISSCSFFYERFLTHRDVDAWRWVP